MSKFIFFGAHPDDADELMGGTAIKLARKGHEVIFVSVANGDCGHFSMDRKELAVRRYNEAQASAALAGIKEYIILDHHDCELECNLPLREELLRIIRRKSPDIVISHRICDYHADHRAVGQLVMDCAYLLKVPLYCNDTPIPDVNPIFAYAYDPFSSPRSIRPDAAVEIDSVLEIKFKMLDCHCSQYYEWLAWDNGYRDFNVANLTWEEKREWLDRNWIGQGKKIADLGRNLLGTEVNYAEIFEQSEYGRIVSPEEFNSLFNR